MDVLCNPYWTCLPIFVPRDGSNDTTLKSWMFTFLSKKYQAHSLGVARRGRARLGTWTLHTQGALGGGGQFNNWSESQKRGELISGVNRGQWGWGRGAVGFRPRLRDWQVEFTAALQQELISGAGVTWPGSAICVCPRSSRHTARPEFRGSRATPPGLSEPTSLCVIRDKCHPGLPSWGCEKPRGAEGQWALATPRASLLLRPPGPA